MIDIRKNNYYMVEVYNSYFDLKQLGLYQAIPSCSFSYNNGKNVKKAILKEYINEIKSLINYQVVSYFVHLFSIGARAIETFNEQQGLQIVFATKEQRRLSTALNWVKQQGSYQPLRPQVSYTKTLWIFKNSMAFSITLSTRLGCEGRQMK